VSIRTEHEVLSRPHKTQTYILTDLLSFYFVSVNKSYILKYIGYNLKVYHHRHVPEIVTDHSQAVFHTRSLEANRPALFSATSNTSYQLFQVFCVLVRSSFGLHAQTILIFLKRIRTMKIINTHFVYFRLHNGDCCNWFQKLGLLVLKPTCLKYVRFETILHKHRLFNFQQPAEFTFCCCNSLFLAWNRLHN
jgi:hypothetical protein